MAAYRITPYQADQFERWNHIVDQANGGTIFHRLDFLAYHGERFRANEHHVMIYRGEAMHGVMPMAIFSENGKRIARSPYGGSYGGPVLAYGSPLTYRASQGIVSALLNYLLENNVNELRLTLPIDCCYNRYSETFYLVLAENGFQCINRDISSVVNLDSGHSLSDEISSRARNMAKKARKLGVTCQHMADVHEFWGLMEKTFDRHGKKPTHSLREFEWLCEHFPDSIYVDIAYLDDRPVAGIGFFVLNKRVNSSFYLCMDQEYRDTQAQSLLIYDALLRSQQQGFCWFDFGTSSVNQQGRENIFRFKESFGAIGQFRQTYVWKRSN